MNHDDAVQARLKVFKIHSERNAAEFNARTDPKKLERLSARFEAIQRSAKSPHNKLAAFWEVADEMYRDVGGNVACKRGCSHCCHIAVGVMTVEAELIGKRIGRKPRTVPGRTHFRDFDYGYHNPCTFLRDGECSIYEHRPLACRIHFNLDIDPLLCELTPPESSPVPMFNTREHQFGALLLMGGPSNHNRLGDIREFFPRATHE